MGGTRTMVGLGGHAGIFLLMGGRNQSFSFRESIPPSLEHSSPTAPGTVLGEFLWLFGKGQSLDSFSLEGGKKKNSNKKGPAIPGKLLWEKHLQGNTLSRCFMYRNSAIPRDTHQEKWEFYSRGASSRAVGAPGGGDSNTQ